MLFWHPFSKTVAQNPGSVYKKSKKRKLNFSSEHVECSFRTTLKIYCSKTEGMKNIVTLFPANISHKTFLWTRIMQSWQPWQKVIAQNWIVYHSKTRLSFFVVSDFFFQKLLWINRRQFDSPARSFLFKFIEKIGTWSSLSGSCFSNWCNFEHVTRLFDIRAGIFRSNPPDFHKL